MASELRNERKAWSVLIVSTLAFTVCFMVWMMFGVIGIPIKKMLNLNATEFGLLTAMPVLTGSLVRVPLGNTVVKALEEAGVEVQVSCEQGVCGTCLTRALEGTPDHKDMYLTPEEQAANDQFLPCCSRSKSARLVLDL